MLTPRHHRFRNSLPGAALSWLLGICLLCSAAGCESDDSEDVGSSSGDSGGSGNGDGDSDGTDGDGADTLPPAYLVSAVTRSPDAATSLYYVLDNLESQTLDPQRALETAQGDAFTYGGRIYIYTPEDAKLTEYDLDENNEFVKGRELSLLNFGIADLSFGSFPFVSDTQAFLLSSNGQIIQWNPSTMEITDSMTLDTPVYEGITAFPTRMFLSGDELIVTLAWIDFTTFAKHDAAAYLRVPLDLSAQTLVEKTDCGLSWQSAQASNGDIYVVMDQYFGAFFAFGFIDTTCLFRISSTDTSSYDPNFAVDVLEVTDGDPINAMVIFEDTLWLTSIDLEATELDPGDPSSYFSNLKCDLWSGTPGDPSSLKERPELQVAPGDCGMPAGSFDGIAFKETGGSFPAVVDLSLQRMTETGLEPAIELRASYIDGMFRVR